jgi:hypothetical protein
MHITFINNTSVFATFYVTMISAEELKEYLYGVPKNMNFNSNDIFKMLKRRI